MSNPLLAAGLEPISRSATNSECASEVGRLDCLDAGAEFGEEASSLYEEAEAIRLKTPPQTPRVDSLPKEASSTGPPVATSLLLPGLFMDGQSREGAKPAGLKGIRVKSQPCRAMSEASTAAPLRRRVAGAKTQGALAGLDETGHEWARGGKPLRELPGFVEGEVETLHDPACPQEGNWASELVSQIFG